MNTENISQYVNLVKDLKPLILITVAFLAMTAGTVLVWSFYGMPGELFSVDGWLETPVSLAWTVVTVFVMVTAGRYAFKTYFKGNGTFKAGVSIGISLGLLVLVGAISHEIIDVL